MIFAVFLTRRGDGTFESYAAMACSTEHMPALFGSGLNRGVLKGYRMAYWSAVMLEISIYCFDQDFFAVVVMAGVLIMAPGYSRKGRVQDVQWNGCKSVECPEKGICEKRAKFL